MHRLRTVIDGIIKSARNGPLQLRPGLVQSAQSGLQSDGCSRSTHLPFASLLLLALLEPDHHILCRVTACALVVMRARRACAHVAVRMRTCRCANAHLHWKCARAQRAWTVNHKRTCTVLLHKNMFIVWQATQGRQVYQMIKMPRRKFHLFISGNLADK